MVSSVPGFILWVKLKGNLVFIISEFIKLDVTDGTNRREYISRIIHLYYIFHKP